VRLFTRGRVFIGVVVVSTLMLFGVAEETVSNSYKDLQSFAKVLNLIKQYYVEEVDTKRLIYGGIKGMLGELDPHTNFLPPEIYKEFEKETSGEFGGIGVEIAAQDGVLIVVAPIEDTPAWRAGIEPGDKIVGVNGKPTKGMSIAEAAKEMRGELGSPVELTIARDSFEVPKVFKIVRAVVKLSSVKYQAYSPEYAYIRITSFIESTSKDVKKALEKHKKKHKSLKGVMIDLRRNPGGLLEQAVEVSDLFLTKGVIVSTRGRVESEKEVIYANAKGTYESLPVVVLIDGSSASASEILAGALQDNKRGLIVGQQSFGKGSVQSVVKLGDGSALKLTVARYYTPNGVSIQAEGIKPDIQIQRVDADAFKKAIISYRSVREKDIAGHLENEKSKKPAKARASKKISLDEDYQVRQAFNYLKTYAFAGKKGS
jgi:carboxyl-terminal processing protease